MGYRVKVISTKMQVESPTLPVRRSNATATATATATAGWSCCRSLHLGQEPPAPRQSLSRKAFVAASIVLWFRAERSAKHCTLLFMTTASVNTLKLSLTMFHTSNCASFILQAKSPVRRRLLRPAAVEILVLIRSAQPHPRACRVTTGSHDISNLATCA